MGGDFGPSVVVQAAADYLQEHQDVSLILVGDQEAIEAELSNQKIKPYERLKIHHTTQCVEMDEPPKQALRNKKDSSMRVAINLVKEGEADAAVSAGNTGALMATARYVLKMLPGIDRPAITSLMPNMQGKTFMLDLGANVGCTSEHLLQFAVMGSVFATAVAGIPNPKVGLLNVGEEEIYVEGDDIYCGEVEVVVCDGFVGNVSLKTSEGVAKIVAHYAKHEFTRNWFTKICGLLAMPVLKAFKTKIDPRRYNGASLLGLRGVVVKSHGGADAFSFQHAIDIARAEAVEQVPKKIESKIEEYLIP